MLELSQSQKQSQILAPLQQQGLRLLAKSLPELRSEVVAEIERNPALEDVDHPLERSVADIQREREGEDSVREADYSDADDYGRHDSINRDADAQERREAFFANYTGEEESLQQHLLSQLPLSDIPEGDWQLVESIVSELDDGGRFKGSLADIVMAYERSEEEVRAVMAKVRELDPPGCAAITAKECLAAQLDAVSDELRESVAYLIDHLEELADGRIDGAEYGEAIKALRTLDPHPGRRFPSERDRVEYVNPEVHAVRYDDGRWHAETDKRSLPEIRISPKFQALLADPAASDEVKRYVRERIAAGRAFRELIEKRQQTIERIAQFTFDRQQDFFNRGFKALRPLTELEIAEQVGVTGPTVSRTVNGKYTTTPWGTVELRRFFSNGVKTAAGESVSQQAVLEELRRLVDGEDKSKPLTDDRLAAELAKVAGVVVARRTVAKYRDKLGIPGTSKRRTR